MLPTEWVRVWVSTGKCVCVCLEGLICGELIAQALIMWPLAVMECDSTVLCSGSLSFQPAKPIKHTLHCFALHHLLLSASFHLPPPSSSPHNHQLSYTYLVHFSFFMQFYMLRRVAHSVCNLSTCLYSDPYCQFLPHLSGFRLLFPVFYKQLKAPIAFCLPHIPLRFFPLPFLTNTL